MLHTDLLKGIDSCGKLISKLQSVTCHMGSHSVTYQPIQADAFLTSTPARQAGTGFTYPGDMDGWVDRPTNNHGDRSAIIYDKPYIMLTLHAFLIPVQLGVGVAFVIDCCMSRLCGRCCNSDVVVWSVCWCSAAGESTSVRLHHQQSERVRRRRGDLHHRVRAHGARSLQAPGRDTPDLGRLVVLQHHPACGVRYGSWRRGGCRRA